MSLREPEFYEQKVERMKNYFRRIADITYGDFKNDDIIGTARACAHGLAELTILYTEMVRFIRDHGVEAVNDPARLSEEERLFLLQATKLNERNEAVVDRYLPKLFDAELTDDQKAHFYENPEDVFGALIDDMEQQVRDIKGGGGR